MSVRKSEAICRSCGHVHEGNGNHLYDYVNEVDEELTCQICLQPLVNPLDTKCGHTFCARCIRGFLKMKKMCPIDRLALTIRDCRTASIMVQKLLDKLVVYCPNNEKCSETMQRSDLEAHLIHRCKGTTVRCLRAPAGCRFKGTPTALKEHMQKCTYKHTISIDGTKNRLYRARGHLRLAQGDDSNCASIRDMRQVRTPVTCITAIPRLPVLEGEITTIEVRKSSQSEHLGISVVGGCETPLVSMIVQEVFSSGAIATDGRIGPGDQILEVNGEDLRELTHHQACRVLRKPCPLLRLTILRERVAEERNTGAEVQDTIRVELTKTSGEQLGIRIAGLQGTTGVCVRDLVEGGLAATDGRLRPRDVILEINGQDMRQATSEQAAELIQASVEKVDFVVSRPRRPQPPDLIKGMLEADTSAKTPEDSRPPSFQDKLISIRKNARESLGISVAGGRAGTRGDVPVFVTNVQPDGCLGGNGQLKKGDILVSINGTTLVGLTHEEAVGVLRASALSQCILLRAMAPARDGDSDEEEEDDFDEEDPTTGKTPSWIMWMRLPEICQVPKSVQLERGQSGSLGFSIVGGCDGIHGKQPILVKSIVPGGSADRDGRLRCGDLILSANGHLMTSISHTMSVTLLKRLQGSVMLAVVSWPGTML
ncbi:ligand of Numb protein X 2-like isoform X1 [Branchiostoma floridae]|uniref:Ligand of Numb protein X 2-like isoform X1 n=1 Tax=Branchiostoma floridae TaxID=7739 RepID=A0A9J7MVJ2_BRAFL|nr:ligand of Numb protein X 2-like isoform X1 [Branchiostoma floridae]